mgnify:CR=1 FL=1
MSIATPTTASVTTMTFGRAERVLEIRKASPIGTSGIVPTMISQEEARGPIRDRRNRLRQRHHHGDEVVPEIDEDGGQRADVAGHVEGTAELFGVPAEERLARIRWAELDTGRNSVSPWTMPSSAAWRSSTAPARLAYDTRTLRPPLRGRSTASSTARPRGWPRPCGR